MYWQARNTALSAQPRVTRSVNFYLNSTTRHWTPYRQRVTQLTDHHVAGIKRQLKPNTSPHHLAVEVERQRLQDTCMTYDRTWTIGPVIQDQSMDQGGVLQCTRMAIRPGGTGTTLHKPKTIYGLHPNYVVTWPDIEVPHTLFASLTM